MESAIGVGGDPHFPGSRGRMAPSAPAEGGWPRPLPEESLNSVKKTRSPARTSDPVCRILTLVSGLFGNLDAARSVAAVRPGTTRRVVVRVVRPVDP